MQPSVDAGVGAIARGAKGGGHMMRSASFWSLVAGGYLRGGLSAPDAMSAKALSILAWISGVINAA